MISEVEINEVGSREEIQKHKIKDTKKGLIRVPFQIKEMAAIKRRLLLLFCSNGFSIEQHGFYDANLLLLLYQS